MAAKKKTSQTPAPKSATGKPKKATKRRPEEQAELPPAAEATPVTETTHAETPATERAIAEALVLDVPSAPEPACKNCQARTTDLRPSGYCSEWCEQEAAGPQPSDPTPGEAAETTAPASEPSARPVTVEAAAPKKLSAIDAAARVLAETGQAMNCQELIAAMAAKGYWTSPGGKTPASTLYSAVLREITVKGDQARFVKAERGKFALRG